MTQPSSTSSDLTGEEQVAEEQAPAEEQTSAQQEQVPVAGSESQQLQGAAASVAARLEHSQSVFVPRTELADADKSSLEGADFNVEHDVVRDGYFVSRLTETQRADREFAAQREQEGRPGPGEGTFQQQRGEENPAADTLEDATQDISQPQLTDTAEGQPEPPPEEGGPQPTVPEQQPSA